jgi:nitroreductase
MEASEVLRTTGSVRVFTSEPVSDDVVYEILDVARYAPSGGNRQAWRVIHVRDAAMRREVANIYLESWHEYVSHVLAGVIPFSPLANDADRAAALAQHDNARAASVPQGFAETIADVPVMLVVLANLEGLAATDRDLNRYTLVGGASIYPFVWSILLEARSRNLSGVMTTVATRNEPEVLRVLGIPNHYALAAIVVLGHPQNQIRKLKRRPVESFATIDHFDGAPLTRH